MRTSPAWDTAVLQPGLPAGRGAARAAQPEDPHGAAGHPRLLDDRVDRTSRRRRTSRTAKAAGDVAAGVGQLRPGRARITPASGESGAGA
jgi:hypothetical protein